jgi:anti-sigma regulatory factor (Ser/Thr protein kinase)
VDVRSRECAEFAVPEALRGVPLAREFTRATLAGWRCGAELLSDALLVVTELVTNALLHGHGVPVVRLAARPGRLRIEVVDGSPLLPVRRTAGPDGGWGLGLVERLAAAWGATQVGPQKVVWAELSEPSATPAD